MNFNNTLLEYVPPELINIVNFYSDPVYIGQIIDFVNNNLNIDKFINNCHNAHIDSGLEVFRKCQYCNEKYAWSCHSCDDCIDVSGMKRCMKIKSCSICYVHDMRQYDSDHDNCCHCGETSNLLKVLHWYPVTAKYNCGQWYPLDFSSCTIIEMYFCQKCIMKGSKSFDKKITLIL